MPQIQKSQNDLEIHLYAANAGDQNFDAIEINRVEVVSKEMKHMRAVFSDLHHPLLVTEEIPQKID